MAKPRRHRPAEPTAKYDAGGTGRRIAGWRAPSSGPRQATEGLVKVRDRARDATRNDWSASSVVQKWAANLIGVGIRPRFKRIPEGPRRQYIADLWEDFTRTSDSDGVLDFYGQQTLGVRTWFDSGEAFVRFRPRLLDAPLAVPLQVQLVEGDYVPMLTTSAWPGMPEGNRIVQGIEINNYGRRVAYWMHKEHPGEASTTFEPQALVRVPASQVRHLYEPKRIGQMRGVSELSAALIRMRMGGDLEDAVLDRQRLANLYTAFITKAMPADWEDIDVDPNTGLPKWYDAEDGRAVAAMSPGTSQELLPGESVTFANPPEAGISHSDYMRTVHMGSAAAGGIPYELMSGDIRNVSDRTLRVVILEFRRLARQRQWQVVIPMMCQPTVEAFAAAALLAGKIRLSEFDAVRRPEWSPEGWEHIHPVQDPQGKILEIEAGLRSRSGVIAERGDDSAQVDQERADDMAREKRLNLGPDVVPPPAGQQQQAAAMERMLEVMTGIAQRGPEAQVALVDTLRALEARAAAPQPAPEVTVNVTPGAVTVGATTINVAPAAVQVDNHVETPEVTVAAPDVTVVNNVPPAEVSVAVELPPRQTISEIDRDDAGQIVQVTQTETTLQ